MPVSITCPKCGAKCSVPEELRGCFYRCPKCKDWLTVPTLTRNEFRALVMMKTKEEVNRIVGPPDSVGTSEDVRREHWNYCGKTINPATGKADKDELTIVVIDNGFVVDVHFAPKAAP